jgi:hypothetical protein
MKNIIILLFAVTMFSCNLGKNYCSKHYHGENSDSVWTVTTYCWDTVLVPIPYEGISFDTSGVIPNNVEFHHTQTKNHLTQTIGISKGRITLDCHEAEYQKEIARLNTIISTTDRSVKVVHDPCDKDHKTKWNYFCTYFTWIILIALVLRFVIKYFTGK